MTRTVLEDEREDVALPDGAERLPQRKGWTACRLILRHARRHVALIVILRVEEAGQTMCQRGTRDDGLDVRFWRTHTLVGDAPHGRLPEDEFHGQKLLQLPALKVCPAARILAANRGRHPHPIFHRGFGRSVRGCIAVGTTLRRGAGRAPPRSSDPLR